MNKTFFMSILLGIIDDIIKEYDGEIILDKYSYNKFKDGKWFTKDLDKNSKYEEMQYKNMDVYDLAGEINALVEGIVKSQFPLIFEIKVKNTNII